MKAECMDYKCHLAKGISLLTFIWLCTITGCGGGHQKESPGIQDHLLYPHALYLTKSSCPYLYVEIDRIGKVQVPDAYIDTIRTFLSTCCGDSKIIRICQDSPYEPEGKKVPVEYLSLLCMDGPSQNYENAAYLHFVFYDSTEGYLSVINNPRVISQWPNTVFFNVNYLMSDIDAQVHGIRHELGHVLGLCQNPEHGDRTHCYNKCLMKAWVDNGISTPLFKLLGTSVKGAGLCGQCIADLEHIRMNINVDHLVYKGPFLIRQEDDYAVTSLLGYYVIIPLECVDVFDWQKTLSQIKMEVYRSNRQLPTQPKRKAFGQRVLAMHASVCLYNTETGVDFNDRIRDPLVLEKLRNDPDFIVMGFARLTLEVNRLEQIKNDGEN
jgi:hypothetical protein